MLDLEDDPGVSVTLRARKLFATTFARGQCGRLKP